jgi:uncharacterized tellurite resistance protein B-like protein
MSIITRFLSAIIEPEFKLARDLTAMAIADGEVTPEEKEAMRTICHLEGIDESRLMEALRGGYEHVNEEMPNDQQGKDEYLRNLIKLIGADGYASPQEIYLFQIIAGRMGLNQMDVVGLFFLMTNRRYFKGDTGAKVLASFLRNCIDPKGKTEKDNRESLCAIFDTIASNTEVYNDDEVDREIIRQNLARATETLIENKILIKEFEDMGLDFSVMVKQEELKIFKRYTSN